MATKIIHFLRHGQAAHNPRAEAARHAGCSYEQFLQLMKEDDAYDADLTVVGRQQAEELGHVVLAAAAVAPSRTAAAATMVPAADAADLLAKVDLVAASTLSRAIDTADLVFPPVPSVPRLALDEWREISGLLLNAKRRPRSELARKYAGWDFSGVQAEQDDLWRPAALEEQAAVAARGYAGLRRLWALPFRNVVIAAHGGIFHFLLDSPGHPAVLADDAVRRRFGNCELVRRRPACASCCVLLRYVLCACVALCILCAFDCVQSASLPACRWSHCPSNRSAPASCRKSGWSRAVAAKRQRPSGSPCSAWSRSEVSAD